MSTLPSTNNDSSTGLLQGPFDLPISPQTTLLTLLPDYTTLSPADASAITADFSCAASHSAWLSSVHEPTNYATLTVTTSTSFEAPVILGTADVYTTSAGLAYAHGNFTPTSTSMWTFNGPTFTTTSSMSPGPDYPSCSVGPIACSLLSQSVWSSLGLPSGASITQLPNWSLPDCVIPSPTTTASALPSNSDLPCQLTGRNVEVLYWPSPTITNGPSVQTATTVISGSTMTFTSPSVYLSFDMIGAYHLITGHQNVYEPVGATRSNQWVAVDPSDISSMILTSTGLDMSSAALDIATGGTSSNRYVTEFYRGWNGLVGPAEGMNMVPQFVDFDALTKPDPVAYYFGAGWQSGGVSAGPPGCNDVTSGFQDIMNPRGPAPECATVFQDLYHAQLAVPKAVRALDPAWAQCDVPLYGVYDPPIALQAAGAVKGPAGATTTNSAGGPKTTGMDATPPSTPVAPTPTVTGTAQQDNQPTTTAPADDPSPAPEGHDTGNSGSGSSGSDPVSDNTPSQAGTQGAPDAVIYTLPSTTYTLSPPASSPAPLDQASPVQSSVLVMGSQTITLGGSTQVVDRHTMALGSAGLVVDGSTAVPSPISGQQSQGTPGPMVYTLPSATYTLSPATSDPATPSNVSPASASSIQSSVLFMSSQTLTLGGSAQVVDGHTVALGLSGLVVDGATATAQLVQSTASSVVDPGQSDSGTSASPSVSVQTASGADHVGSISVWLCGSIPLLFILT
nr:hypothetical protein B0A51_01884 [Rachicladosporium sp. CCFEE 5018]